MAQKQKFLTITNQESRIWEFLIPRYHSGYMFRTISIVVFYLFHFFFAECLFIIKIFIYIEHRTYLERNHSLSICISSKYGPNHKTGPNLSINTELNSLTIFSGSLSNFVLSHCVIINIVQCTYTYRRIKVYILIGFLCK